MQFVAAPTGSGHSVDAQIIGKDSIAGLQVEIIPMKRKATKIVLRKIDGEIFEIDARHDMRVWDVMDVIERKAGIAYRVQRLFLEGSDVQLQSRQ